MELIENPKKSLGQNFLIDKNIIKKIIKIGNINNNTTVLEIGSGYGALTSELVNANPKKIYAIEKDKKLSSYLMNKFNNFKNVKIINDDFLNIIKEKKWGKNIVVFGNLPYNVSTQILISLIMLNKWPPWYKCLVLMFQEEVANRILAKSSTKEFNRLSVIANWRLEVKKQFNISNNCFFPKPKINSTLLSFKPIETNAFILKDPKSLEKVTRILFSNKRKMINKNFTKLFKKNTSSLNELNINLNKRPEELSRETFYKIASIYEKLFS